MNTSSDCVGIALWQAPQSQSKRLVWIKSRAGSSFDCDGGRQVTKHVTTSSGVPRGGATHPVESSRRSLLKTTALCAALTCRLAPSVTGYSLVQAPLQYLLCLSGARAQLLGARALAYSSQLSLDLNSLIGWSEYGQRLAESLVTGGPRPPAPNPLPFTGAPEDHFDELKQRISDAPLPEYSALIPADGAVPTSSWSATRAELSGRVLALSGSIAEFEEAASLIDAWREHQEALQIVSDNLDSIEENYLRLAACPPRDDTLCKVLLPQFPEFQIAFRNAMGAAWITASALKSRAGELAELARQKREQVEATVMARAKEILHAALLLKNRLIVEAAALSSEREALRLREEALQRRHAQNEAAKTRLNRLRLEKDALVGDIQEHEEALSLRKEAVATAERELQANQVVYRDMLDRTQNYKAIFLRDRVCPGGRPYDDCRTPAARCTEPNVKPAFDNVVTMWRSSLSTAEAAVTRLSSLLDSDDGLRSQLRSTMTALSRYRNRARDVDREIGELSRALTATDVELKRDLARYIEDRNRTAADVYGSANDHDRAEVARSEGLVGRWAR